MLSEHDAIFRLLSDYFSEATLGLTEKILTPEEVAEIDAVISDVKARFSGMKYILGLALDFTFLAEQISNYDARFAKTQKDLTYDEIFEIFSLVEKRGKRAANTLTFRMADGTQFGIRKIEEQIVDFFHSLRRSAYPSAYVYNTGQWRKFEELLLSAFKLGSAARFFLAKRLIQFGLSELTENSFWIREVKRVRVFSEVIEDGGYERTFSGQNGGLILQAIFFGFFKADRPHLDFVVDKVRTGSSRQHRFGDIDGYYGADLELTSEVKDLEITTSNLERQCGGFLKSCESYGISGIIACEEVTADARDEILAAGCSVLSLRELRSIVSYWDWPKQDAAFCSCLHYLSHVEQDADATLRMLHFVRSIDKTHSMLAYLKS